MNADTTPHPLDPLSADEVRRAVAVVRAHAGPDAQLRVVSIETREPAKDGYLAWRDAAGPRPPREASLVLLDHGRHRGAEAVVSLDADRVSAFDLLGPDVQPAIHIEEYDLAGAIVRADADYRAALALRGIDDPEQVHVEAWSIGKVDDHGRLVRCISWLRADADDVIPYAQPLYGLLVTVDLHAEAVVRVDDAGPGTRPRARNRQDDYRRGGGRPYREDLRPIDIRQPEGPSFELDGHHLSWQKWDLRVGLHPREGLVLHDLAYVDAGERRQVCHRASIAELVIPYGDPNPTVHFKNVFDTGEYGLGNLTNSLVLGCDCLGEIRYLDGVAADLAGVPVVIGNAICIHEEDVNLLWKHSDDRTGSVDRARSRRLAISSIATVGNYEYAFFWYLYQDASWQFEAKLTGIVHTAGWVAGERSPYSLPLGDGIVTSHHQHFFCARLDLDLDGTANTACEVEARSEPFGPQNPDGIAFRPQRLTYERESQARRALSPETARRFRVENGARRNRIGDAVAYELVPGDNVAPMAQPTSAFRERARFLDHALWVSRYARNERYPAGEYPNQHPGGDGLPRWTEADRSLLDEDVVLWYVFGAHHFPRLEDWPVMPVVSCGFQLRPVGFFDYNPALDVPPPTHCAHDA